MRHLCVASLLLGAGSAFASFDLMLVADNPTSGSTGAPATIRRFDPVTGAYLGSFGNSVSNFTNMVTVAARHQVYVGTAAGQVLAYDYNSGELVNSYTGNWTSMKMNAAGDHILVTNGSNNVYSYDLDFAGGTTLINRPSYTITSAMQFASGAYAIEDVAGSTIYVYSNPTTGISSITGLVAGSFKPMFGVGFGSAGLGFPTNAGANQEYMNMYSVASTGVINYLGSPSPSLTTGWLMGAPAHTGCYAMGSFSGATGRTIFKLAPNGAVGNYFTSGLFTNPVAMDTFLAPEPGTWAALGLGALALIRRRKTA